MSTGTDNLIIKKPKIVFIVSQLCVSLMLRGHNLLKRCHGNKVSILEAE